MPDLREDLATLVADAAATLEALRLQGVILLPRADGPAHAPAAEPHPELTARVRPTPPPAPPPRPVAPEPPPVPLAPAPAPLLGGSAAAAPAPAGGARPLLGAWAALAEGPAERLAKAQAALGERCEACGAPPLLGSGALSSGVVLVADPLTPAQQAVLTNMLVRVVSVEPGDVWTAAPRTCPRCAQGLREQVQAIRPRVVLALGREAAALIELPERGTWGLWAGAAAVSTWHPAEMELDAGLKRPAFEVLQAVARRR